VPQSRQRPPLERVDALVLAPRDAVGRSVVAFGAHAEVRLQQAAVRQEARVVGFVAAPRQCCSQRPLRRAPAGQRIASAQHDRVGALAETDDDDRIAGFGLFERSNQHQQWMRRAGVAAIRLQRIDQRRARKPGLGGDALRIGPRHCEQRDGLRRNTRARQRGTHDAGRQPGERFIADPAFFERIVEVAAAHSVVVDEVSGFMCSSQHIAQCRRGRARRRNTADEQCGGAMAEQRFLRTARPREARIAADNQGRARPFGGRGQRPGGGAQRTAEFECLDLRIEVEAGRRERGIAAVGERQGGRGEQEGIYRRRACQRATCCIDRKRQRVFIPVAETARALRACRAAQPAHRRGDRRARQPQARDAGTGGDDLGEDGHRVSFRRRVRAAA
jgi:hypothetical protein